MNTGTWEWTWLHDHSFVGYGTNSSQVKVKCLDVSRETDAHDTRMIGLALALALKSNFSEIQGRRA